MSQGGFSNARNRQGTHRSGTLSPGRVTLTSKGQGRVRPSSPEDWRIKQVKTIREVRIKLSQVKSEYRRTLDIICSKTEDITSSQSEKANAKTAIGN